MSCDIDFNVNSSSVEFEYLNSQEYAKTISTTPTSSTNKAGESVPTWFVDHHLDFVGNTVLL